MTPSVLKLCIPIVHWRSFEFLWLKRADPFSQLGSLSLTKPVLGASSGARGASEDSGLPGGSLSLMQSPGLLAKRSVQGSAAPSDGGGGGGVDVGELRSGYQAEAMAAWEAEKATLVAKDKAERAEWSANRERQFGRWKEDEEAHFSSRQKRAEQEYQDQLESKNKAVADLRRVEEETREKLITARAEQAKATERNDTEIANEKARLAKALARAQEDHDADLKALKPILEAQQKRLEELKGQVRVSS